MKTIIKVLVVSLLFGIFTSVTFGEECTFYPPYTDPYTTFVQYEHQENLLAEKGHNYAISDCSGNLSTGLVQHNIACQSNSYVWESYVRKTITDNFRRTFTVPINGQYEITFNGSISGDYYELATSILGAGKGKSRFWLAGGVNYQVLGQAPLYETDLSLLAFLSEAGMEALWTTLGVLAGDAGAIVDLAQYFGDLSGLVDPVASWPPRQTSFSIACEKSLSTNTNYIWDFWINSDITSHSVGVFTLQNSSLESYITLQNVKIKYLGEIPANQPPILTSGGVNADPAGPDLYPHTELEFYVNYDDPEEYLPQAISVKIDGVLYPMRQDAGHRYIYKTTGIAARTHLYSFYAVDKQGATAETSSKFLTIQEFNAGSFEFTGAVEINDSKDIYSVNNGDGQIQSGEVVSIRPQIKYADDASEIATHIDVTLISNDSKVEEVYSPENYPDMLPGEASYPDAGEYFKVKIDKTFSVLGGIYLDAGIEWRGQDGEELHYYIDEALLLNVQPEAWIYVSPNEYDFGAVKPRPEDDVVLTFKVKNNGSELLNVSDIQVSDADTEIDPRVFSVEPGQSVDVDVTIHVSDLNGTITRIIHVIHDGRFDDPEDEYCVITGLVSNTPLQFEVPTVDTFNHQHDPDISGSKIVFEDDIDGDGSDEIMLYDISTGQERLISPLENHAADAYVDGDLVVFADSRNWNGTGYWNDNQTIVVYDLNANQEVIISAGPSSQEVVGLSGSLIATLQPYQTLEDPTDAAYNLVVYNYLGNGQVTQIYTTGFTPVGGTGDRPGVLSYVDFNNGMLVFVIASVHWDGGAGYGANSLYKIDFAAGENNKSSVNNPSGTNTFAAGLHNLVYQDRDPVLRDDHIYLWPGNTRITPDIGEDYADNYLAFNGNIVIYDKSSSDNEMYLWDISQGTEGLITNLLTIQDEARMDGNGVVWQQRYNDGTLDWHIHYAFLNQSDVSVSSSNITFSDDNPVEGSTVDIDVRIQNSTEYNATGDITVKLFEGDPDEDGVQVGNDLLILGGYASQMDEVYTFPSIPVGVEGYHEIYAQVLVDGFDIYANNKASKVLIVGDSCLMPPNISNVWITEYNGDGDGLVESDENVLVQWKATSACSSIASTYCQIADVNYVGEGNYYVILDPFAEGNYSFTIYAADNDFSPESSTYDRTFSVAVASIEGDLNNDGVVDMVDFAKLALQWMNDNCSNATRWCRGADIDHDLVVNTGDLEILSENWLNELFIPFFVEPLDVNPGWSVQGEWQFGEPAGLGGGPITGNSDPTSGYTGDNVYGVNLNGDYRTLAGGPYNLTTASIHCSDYHDVHLKFARWLNSDYAPYLSNKVEVSNDNLVWHTVWESSSSSPMEDSDWQIMEYDISSYADSQETIYIRWNYQTDGSAFPYSGWNIDDIQLWGSPN